MKSVNSRRCFVLETQFIRPASGIQERYIGAEGERSGRERETGIYKGEVKKEPVIKKGRLEAEIQVEWAGFRVKRVGRSGWWAGPGSQQVAGGL